jgi:hypothetical protein
MAVPIDLYSSHTGVALGAIARAPAAWLTYAVARRLSSLPAAVAYWQTPPLAKHPRKDKDMNKQAQGKPSKKQPKYVIVRCRNAGVHAGEYVAHINQEVTLQNSRRIWYWSGAASLSELAVRGAKNVSHCKFAPLVSNIILLDACEIITCTPEAEKMIRLCPEWSAR